MPSVPGAAPSLLTVGAPSGVPNLAAFLDMMADQAAPATGEQSALPERQGDAEPGNSLPDEDQDEPTGDPALAWLMSGLPGATPQPLPVALPKFQPGSIPVAASVPQDATVPSLPGADATPVATAPAAAQPQSSTAVTDLNAAPQPVQQQPVTPIANLVQPLPATAPADLSATPAAAVVATDAAPAVAQPAVDIAKPRAPIPVAVDPTRLPTPLATALNNARTVTASPAIASTVRTAAAMPAMFALAAGRREERDGDTTGSPTLAGAALLQPTDAAKLIAQPGEMQRQTLDMGRQDWPQQMIDRIETLRDNVDANDTSIRLKPEALGQIDVSIRSHADGAVSVRFTAEQPAARALIADAQPQLAAAAEARGIRLSGTSVDLAGSGQGGGDRSRPQAEANRNTSNRLASSGDDITADSDGRIA
jgi:flagellar hook-length control protein FliK